MQRISRAVTLVALAALVPNASALAQADTTPPHISSIVPGPAGGVHGSSGLPSLFVQFSEPVVVASAPNIWAVGGGQVSFTSTYIASTNTLRIDFAPVLAEDRVTVVLGEGIADGAGNPLDGEILSPMGGGLPSGDGVPGGLAVFRYDILTGDANGDGVTNSLDAAAIIASFGDCAGNASFNPGADLNGDDCVNVLDVAVYLAGLGGILPTLDGTPPTVQSMQRADGAPLAADLETLSVTFSEPLNPRSISPDVITFQSLSGQFHRPVKTTLQTDGRTVTCRFAPPLTACGNYTAHISNAISDLSGELYVPPAQAPRFNGSTPPSAPVLNAYPQLTASPGVTLSGTIPTQVGLASAARVRIQGPDQVLDNIPVDAAGGFSATMPLEPNEINYLYVSAISPCGVSSAPRVAEVARDILPPNLTIQFPADGTQTFDAAVNVGGSIGDTISGFEGLSVTVNGRVADVDIGVGQNGTWVATKVPLNKVGVPTTLTVVAADVLGNSVTRTRTITRVAPPVGSPSIQVLSGDDQIGTVRAPLAAPLAVRVVRGDGTPFVNKPVTFSVTQEDGRLSGPGFGSGTMSYQVLTDASGLASALLTLGSTAGCGNNRVEATALDVAGVARFSATALARPAGQVNIGSGNDQRVEVGSAAPLPLSAWVSDSNNPVAGVPVTFTVIEGGGRVNGLSAVTIPTTATGHAEVSFTAGAAEGVNRVEATFNGNGTSPAVFTTYGIARDFTQPTSFRGLVLDNASRPIGRVKVTLKFGTTLTSPVLTNDQGQFEFPSIPYDGAVHVIVEGFTANKLNGQPIPPGMSFPSLGYDTSIVPNAENTLGKPILLPPLLEENSVMWNGQNDIELTCAGIEGLKFRVKAGSMRLENGSQPTAAAPVKLSLNQVHHDDIPMPMPNGVAPAFAWTFQPASATFDPPVEVEYPNMSVLPPGATAYFLTFNHDLGEFEIMAPGRVSADGLKIVTAPETGLRLSGWGGACPPYSRTAQVDVCYENNVTSSAACVVETVSCSSTKYFAPLFLSVLELNNTPIAAGLLDHWLGGTGQTLVHDDSSPLAQSIRNDGNFRVWEKKRRDFMKQRAELIASQTPGSSEFSFTIHGMLPVGESPSSCPPGSGCPPGSSTPPMAERVTLDSLAFQLVFGNDAGWGIHGLNCHSSVLMRGDVNRGRTMLTVTFEYELNDFYEFDKCDPWPLPWFGRGMIDCSGAANYLNTVRMSSSFQIPLFQPPEPPVERVASNTVEADAKIDGQFANIISTGGTFRFDNVRVIDAWGPDGPGTPPDGLGDDPLRLMVRTRVGPQRLPFLTATKRGLRLGEGAYHIPIDDLEFSAADPPDVERITLSCPQVLGIGEAVASAVIARFSDGTSADATVADKWTTYRTSNPTIATVSANGVVTGHRQGSVFITAKNESATATRRIEVTAQSTTTTFVGTVVRGDGVPVANAVVVSEFGGQATTDAIGNFSLSVSLPTRSTSVQLLAVATINGSNYQCSKDIGGIIHGGATDAGTLVLQPSGSCSQMSWLPGFGMGSAMPFQSGVGVNAIATFDDGSGPKLYVAGLFSAIGGVPASNVARWDGARWSPVGGGTNGEVKTLAVADDGGGSKLYIGGAFTQAGGQTVNRIAVWASSTGTWSPIVVGSSTGLASGAVNTIVPFADSQGVGVAVGGSFTNAGGNGSADQVAILRRINGIVVWQALGAFGTSGEVQSLASISLGTQHLLFAGGTFTTAGGATGGGGDNNQVTFWNGAAWLPLLGGTQPGIPPNSGVIDSIDALALRVTGSNLEVYIGGDFLAAGGVSGLHRLAKWTAPFGSQVGAWSSLGAPNRRVRALKAVDEGSNTVLYAAGDFTEIGANTQLRRCGRLVGGAWTGIDSGVGGSSQGSIEEIRAIHVTQEPSLAVTVAGYFATVSDSSVACSNIAVWKPADRWRPVGPGIQGYVNAMVVGDDGSGPSLFIGGAFSGIGGVVLNNIARWDGSAWRPLGAGIGALEGGGGAVNALRFYDDDLDGQPSLHVAGSFDSAGSTVAHSIAKWNGTSWLPVPSGSTEGIYLGNSSGTVFTLQEFDGDLFAGGFFDHAGVQPASSVARWSRSQREWLPLGQGVVSGTAPGQVYAIASHDEGDGNGQSLFVGGSFVSAGGLVSNNIARWRGGVWSPLVQGGAVGVTGNSPRVACLLDSNEAGSRVLYVGGRFSTAGSTQNVNNIARWRQAQWIAMGGGVTGGNGSALPIVAALVEYPIMEASGSVPAIVVGGLFQSAGGLSSPSIAQWRVPSAGAPAWASFESGVSGQQLILRMASLPTPWGPQLWVGGDFVSPLGDSGLARWGCPVALRSARFDRVAGDGGGRGGVASSDSSVRVVEAGERFILDGETMRLSTLVARRGSSVRVSGGSRLVVRELIVEPGAIFEWLGGTIEIDGGFWRHPEPIEIGCHDSARLLLTHRAEVHAPLVEVCPLGGLHGEGTLFAPVESSGEIAPLATGLDFDQSFAQNEFGLLRIMREPPSGVDERLAPSLRSRGPAQLSGFLALDWIDEDSGLPLEAWQVPCGLRFEVLSAQEVRGSVRSLHQRPCSSEFQVDLDARSVWAAMPRSLGCPDLDRDGLVTNADLSALFELWGPCTAECCRGDIAPPGGDGVVDSLDLQELSLRLGEAVKP